MADAEQVYCYESVEPFSSERIGAAAVYCSDGRFGEQVDELLHKGLGLPRYDRLAVPGGAGCLAGHFLTFSEEEAAVEQLRFLTAAHQLRRVVLISHQDCGFYTERLHISPLLLESQQLQDMRKAAHRVRGLAPQIAVDAFFARLCGEKVRFEQVPVPP